jgi:SAM-dependent methyltransferase
MENYEPSMSFGDEAAATYEDHLRGDEEETVAFLERLAGGGSALELAIGTGRIALPLAARGIRVDGIDFSSAMVARLRAKPGGDQLSVTMGDFADVPVDGSYRLIYLVYNTLGNLLTQDDQVRCFENVAAPSPTTARSSSRPACRTSSTACSRISTCTRRPSASMRSGSTSAGTTRPRNGTTRPTFA